jgi:hypothetical protein
MKPLSERVAEFLELDGKRTPGPLTLTRYAHGGGRLSFAPDTEHRTLVADFYHEGDREFYTASANLAPSIIREQQEEIERLRGAISEFLEAFDRQTPKPRVSITTQAKKVALRRALNTLPTTPPDVGEKDR